MEHTPSTSLETSLPTQRQISCVELRKTILHDLKRIAIAINELVRDLDKVERMEREGKDG